MGRKRVYANAAERQRAYRMRRDQRISSGGDVVERLERGRQAMRAVLAELRSGYLGGEAELPAAVERAIRILV